METGMILAFIALALAFVSFGMAILTIIIMKSNRKDINEAFAKVQKAWDKASETIAVSDDLHEQFRSQTDTEGNGPPHPPEIGMKWALDHTACDQGHYGHSAWKQVPDALTTAIDR
jgi:hypothetical protein